MKISFHKPHITHKELDIITDTIQTGWLTMGPKTLEFEKAFKHYIKKHAAKYRTLPEADQIKRIVNIIQLNLKANKGKFVVGLGTSLNVADPKLTWGVLSKKPGFEEEFESFLKRSNSTRVQAIARKRIPLKDKYNALDHLQKTTARRAVDSKLATRGMIPLAKFATFTNFAPKYLQDLMNRWDKPFHPEIGTNLRAQLFQNITPPIINSIRNSIVRSVEKWESRVTIKDVSFGGSGDIDNNSLQCSIKFIINNAPESLEEIEVILTRVR